MRKDGFFLRMSHFQLVLSHSFRKRESSRLYGSWELNANRPFEKDDANLGGLFFFFYFFLPPNRTSTMADEVPEQISSSREWESDGYFEIS